CMKDGGSQGRTNQAKHGGHPSKRTNHRVTETQRRTQKRQNKENRQRIPLSHFLSLFFLCSSLCLCGSVPSRLCGAAHLLTQECGAALDDAALLLDAQLWIDRQRQHLVGRFLAD